MEPGLVTWCLNVGWDLSQGGKLRCGARLWRGLPTKPLLRILIREMDTDSVEEERGQNSRFGHSPDLTRLEPWVRVSAAGVKRWERNKFKDIQTSTFHAWLLPE